MKKIFRHQSIVILASLIAGIVLGYGYHILQLKKVGMTYSRIAEIRDLNLSELVDREQDMLAYQSLAYLKMLQNKKYEKAISFAKSNLHDYKKDLDGIPATQRTELQEKIANHLEQMDEGANQ